MGYSTNRQTVLRILPLLEVLKKKSTIRFGSEKPSKLAYYLREGLSAAKHFPEFEDIGLLKEHYRFEVHPGAVIAIYLSEPKVGADGVERLLTSTTIYGAVGPQDVQLGKIMDEALSKTTIEDAEAISEVLGAMLKYSKVCEEVYFPNAKLLPADLDRIWRWTEGKKENWKLIVHGDSGLTLTLADDEKAPPEICYKPKEEA